MKSEYILSTEQLHELAISPALKGVELRWYTEALSQMDPATRGIKLMPEQFERLREILQAQSDDRMIQEIRGTGPVYGVVNSGEAFDLMNRGCSVGQIANYAMLKRELGQTEARQWIERQKPWPDRKRKPVR